MEFKGYAGSGLWVDLSTGVIRKESLDRDLVSRFLGGSGFTNKLAYDLIETEMDPLSPNGRPREEEARLPHPAPDALVRPSR